MSQGAMLFRPTMGIACKKEKGKKWALKNFEFIAHCIGYNGALISLVLELWCL